MAITLDGSNGILSPDFEPSSSTLPTNGLYLPSANTLGLATNGTGKAFLDSAGNLGLGVTPSAWDSGYAILQAGSNGSAFGGRSAANTAYMMSNSVRSGSAWKYINTAATAQFQIENGAFYWFTAPSGTAGNAISFTQAMTLSAAGGLSVGTTSDAGAGNIWAVNSIYVGDGSVSSNAIARAAGTGTGFYFPAANTIGFTTNATERARIDSSGNLLVGTTTAPTQGKMNVVNGFQMTGASTGTAISSNNGSAEVAYLTLGASYNVAGVYDVALGIVNIATTAGKRIIIQNRTAGVYVADGGTSWTSNSDERLKTDLKSIENAAQKVSTLRAVTGRYIVDEEGVSRSFLIAQDVQAVLPEAVDASDPDKLGVAYTDTIPLLVAAIKELTARLEALEAK